jgi:hypothetical protein
LGVRALSAVDCGYRTASVSRGLARAALKDDEEELLLLRAIVYTTFCSLLGLWLLSMAFSFHHFFRN